jgi:hypothetical protein
MTGDVFDLDDGIVDQFLLQHEFGTDLHQSVGDRGAYVLDARQGGDGILDLAGHFGFQLRRRGAGLAELDNDAGQIEIRQTKWAWGGSRFDAINAYTALVEGMRACLSGIGSSIFPQNR